MDEKRKITEEEKKQLAKLFKAMLPNNVLNEDDILWIMNEVENGNKGVDFDVFMKAKKERECQKTCSTCKYYDIPYNPDDVAPCRSCVRYDKWEAKEEEPHFCFKCKHQICNANEEPCISCNEWPHSGYLNMTSKWEPKEEEKEDRRCADCKHEFCPGHKEPCYSCFKIDGDNKKLNHQNWEPKPEEEDKKDIQENQPVRLCGKCKHHAKKITEEPCLSCGFHHENWEEENISKDIQDTIFPEFERIFVALESLDNVILGMKVDINRQFEASNRTFARTRSAMERIQERFEEYEKQQKDILEKINNIEQVVMKNSVGINTTYEKTSAVHDEICKDEDICKDCKYYGMCSGYEGDVVLCKNFKKKDLPAEPLYKIDDIIRLKKFNKDIFVITGVHWSDAQEKWIYRYREIDKPNGRIFSCYEFSIAGLVESNPKPEFKVGDKVKLKAGKTVYTVLSVSSVKASYNDRKIFYRYTLGREGRKTKMTEYESRLRKA